MIDAGDVRAARTALAGRVHRTPVLTSHSLGPGIHLKAECFQRTGSFKLRGALNRVGALSDDERARGVVTLSAGNHAQAAALACREAAVDCRVFMPAGADAAKLAATRAYGASLDTSAATAAELGPLAQRCAEEEGRTLLHPFDDPLVMAGQGTVALELVEQVPDVTTLVVPVSGGGLISGIAAAVPHLKIVGVEPAAKPIAARTLGLLPEGPSAPTIADALTAPYVGTHCLEVIRAHVDEMLTVTEEEIAAAVRFLIGRAKLVAEPGAAVGAAALLHGRYVPEPGEVVGVVVSGGNVAPDTLAGLLAG